MPAIKKRWGRLGYVGKHKRIWTKFGKASRCDNALCKGESKTFGWSNVSGKYRADPKDWKQMCTSCHMTKDHRKRKMSDRDRLQIVVNSLSRIRDEVNFVMQGAYGIAYDMFVSAGIPIIHAQGKREAYADAAKIADQTPSMNFGAGIAKEIRARAALINDKDYDKNNVGG